MNVVWLDMSEFARGFWEQDSSLSIRQLMWKFTGWLYSVCMFQYRPLEYVSQYASPLGKENVKNMFQRASRVSLFLQKQPGVLWHLKN